jgi:membrane-bound ClpP family serine protease
MVFDGIILSFIVGLLRKGNFRGLAQLKLKRGWMFPLLLAVQFVIFIFQNNKILGQVSGIIYIIVYLLGLLFLFINRKNPGFVFILIGVFLNFLVMVLNGGRMPVSEHAASVLDPESP